MRITKHAMDRIAERNIPHHELVECMKHGKHYVNKHDANKMTVIHTALNLYIVCDKDYSTVITVFRKEI